jgi:abnormal spindle-like microcephaly-associated protein
MRVARECKRVVEERQRVEKAAVVVQRRWRAVLKARVDELDRDVLDFQVLARGWMERRRVGVAKRGGGVGRRAVGW